MDSKLAEGLVENLWQIVDTAKDAVFALLRVSPILLIGYVLFVATC